MISTTHNHQVQTKAPARWFRLFTGVATIGMLFCSAILATHHPPIFEVHCIALERDIDTSALYYTDLVQFHEAEQWIINRLD